MHYAFLSGSSVPVSPVTYLVRVEPLPFLPPARTAHAQAQAQAQAHISASPVLLFHFISSSLPLIFSVARRVSIITSTPSAPASHHQSWRSTVCVPPETLSSSEPGSSSRHLPSRKHVKFRGILRLIPVIVKLSQLWNSIRSSSCPTRTRISNTCSEYSCISSL